MEAAERAEILARYLGHVRTFDEAAVRRGRGVAAREAGGAVVAFGAPVHSVGQGPSAREIEVLQLVAGGLTNGEIGAELVLSEETVKSHVRNLLAKLQARSRAHAVGIGFRRGLLQ